MLTYSTAAATEESGPRPRPGVERPPARMVRRIPVRPRAAWLIRRSPPNNEGWNEGNGRLVIP